MSDELGGTGLILLTIGLLLALHNANRFGIAGLFGPLRVRYRGAYAVVGNLFSAYPLAYACSQVPVGFLADRLDPRRLILLGTAGATVAGVVFALTDTYGVGLGMVNAIGQTGSSLSGIVFGPLLDATGSVGSIWWSCIPIGVVRWALLQMIGDEPGPDPDAAAAAERRTS